MKCWKTILAIFTSLVAFAAGAALINGHLESQAAKRREASYQAILSSYQREFQVGLPRVALEASFKSKRTLYSTTCCDQAMYSTDRIQIGIEPDTLVCANKKVYVHFEFGSKTVGPRKPDDPSDVFEKVKLVKSLGQCL